MFFKRNSVSQRSEFLSLGSVVCIPLLNHTTCSPICNDDIAGARPNMNIKVAANVMTYLQDNIFESAGMISNIVYFGMMLLTLDVLPLYFFISLHLSGIECKEKLPCSKLSFWLAMVFYVLS